MFLSVNVPSTMESSNSASGSRAGSARKQTRCALFIYMSNLLEFKKLSTCAFRRKTVSERTAQKSTAEGGGAAGVNNAASAPKKKRKKKRASAKATKS